MIIRLIFGIVFVAALVGGIVTLNLLRDAGVEQFFANRQMPPVTVSVIEAEPVTWRPGLEAIGTARADQGVELAIEAGGIVEAIRFEANERVEEGQLLVQIDDTIEEADLAAAQSTLDLSQEALDRVQTLQERGVSAVTNVDTARTEATSARSQVVRLTAVMAQKALSAPFAGVVGIPQIDVGEYVTPGTVYATLQDLDTMRVEFSIPEQQIRLISIGIPVTVSTEVGTTQLGGEISAIEPRIDANTRLLTLRAEVDNPNGELNPGQFLRVRVDLPEEDGVIAVPQTSVTTNLYGDTVYVVRTAETGQAQGDDVASEAGAETADSGATAAENNAASGGSAPEAEGEALTAEQVFVKTGRRTGGLVEILEGISPGDRIVTAGQNRLSPNAPVVIDNSVSPVVSLQTQ